MKKVIFTALIIQSLMLQAQERGNAIYDGANMAYEGNYLYGNNAYNKYYSTGNNNLMLPNDSVYVLNARILINTLPDAYMAVFNIQQEGLTVAECNKNITERIDKFKVALKKEGVNDDEIFVDLIAQTRIYDYKIVGKTATEVKQGFELKKNIIIKFINHALLEKFMLHAAEQEIYDIVKVDYIINDIEKIQNQLRQEAVLIIENKKKFIVANSALVLTDKGLIQYENLNTIYPNQSYRQYVAAESSSARPSYYNNDTWVKEQRKSKTFYFEKQNPASFDKTINPLMVQVPVQISLDVSVKYYIGKPETKKRK